jgi:adenylate cyclase
VALFLGGWTSLTFLLFEKNILLPLVGPLVAMSLALGSGLAAQWVILSENAKRLAQRMRHIEALFGQSVSPNVLEALKRSPERIRRTETRDVSVLFCDLRGFTAQTSEMEPADVAAMLNEYFNYITAAVFEHDGFIDKFVGDEVMVVFSVPFEQEDHPARAVRTAIAIKQRLAELNRVRAAREQPPLNCGLGIHCGPAAAGHIGSRQRSNYTVVGTTVNLAARIEHFTSGGEILVSNAVRRKLPPEIPVRLWDKVEIRGASGVHELYEVGTNTVGS